MMQPPTQLASANYRCIRMLGRGGCGSVWLARSGTAGQLVCLKTINASDGAAAAAVQEEVATMSKLCHPNCVRLLGEFMESGSQVIVMEYADGGDLAGRIKAAAASQAPFLDQQVLQWFGQLCLGVHHLHAQHILHRDIKPQNIFIKRHPLGDRLLLGDVGISKSLSHTLAQAATAIGTPAYLAPEVFSSRPYGFAADVWSLGCVLYELANLHQAFGGGSSFNELSQRVCTGRTAAMRPGMSPALSDLIFDVLQVNAARRPSVVHLLQSALIAPQVQAFAAEVLAESGEGGEGEVDAAAREALRRQLKECGLRVAALPTGRASGDGEREQRLLGVLARLRREREERARRQATEAASSNGTATITRAGAAASEETGKCLALSPTTSPPPESAAPTAAFAAAPAAAPAAAAGALDLTSVTERARASRAFLEGVLGEEALRHACTLVRDGRSHGRGRGGAEEVVVEARLAAEVFGGPNAKYLQLFLHLLALEEGAVR